MTVPINWCVYHVRIKTQTYIDSNSNADGLDKFSHCV